MLPRLFGECCTRETCPRTPQEDLKLVEADIAKNGYSIRTYPETHPLYDYYSARVQINAKAMSITMCRGVLNPDYIQRVQENVAMLTVGRKLNSDNKVVWKGFAQSVVKENIGGKIELHVESLCAAKDTKLGGPMLQAVQDFVRKTVKFDIVILDSVPSAVGFYEKQGFVRIFPKQGEDTNVVPMKKGGRRKTRRRTKKFRMY